MPIINFGGKVGCRISEGSWLFVSINLPFASAGRMNMGSRI